MKYLFQDENRVFHAVSHGFARPDIGPAIQWRCGIMILMYNGCTEIEISGIIGTNNIGVIMAKKSEPIALTPTHAVPSAASTHQLFKVLNAMCRPTMTMYEFLDTVVRAYAVQQGFKPDALLKDTAGDKRKQPK